MRSMPPAAEVSPTDSTCLGDKGRHTMVYSVNNGFLGWRDHAIMLAGTCFTGATSKACCLVSRSAWAVWVLLLIQCATCQGSANATIADPKGQRYGWALILFGTGSPRTIVVSELPLFTACCS